MGRIHHPLHMGTDELAPELRLEHEVVLRAPIILEVDHIHVVVLLQAPDLLYLEIAEP